MAQLAANTLMIRRALAGPRAVYGIAKHPKLFLAADGKGGGSWRIRYRPHAGAQQRWYTITNDARHSDFAAIAKKAVELLSNLSLHGVDPHATRKPRGGSFGETFELWLERHAKVHKRSWDADERLYKRHVEERLAATAVAAIDRQRVIAVLDEIANAATPVQANRCQSLISAVFSWALDEGLIAAHPALRIRRRGEERVRELVMAPEELKAFWSALNELRNTSATILRLLVLLGGRLNEVCGARRRELSWGNELPTWSMPGERTKNALTTIVPLPPVSAELFRQACEVSGESAFVFPARKAADETAFDKKYVSRQCKAIFRAIGVPDMRLHDLRHQAATGMAQCGVPLEIRQLVQNQITGRRMSIGARYDQHDYASEKRRALELWERRLLAIVEGREIPTERY